MIVPLHQRLKPALRQDLAHRFLWIFTWNGIVHFNFFRTAHHTIQSIQCQFCRSVFNKLAQLRIVLQLWTASFSEYLWTLLLQITWTVQLIVISNLLLNNASLKFSLAAKVLHIIRFVHFGITKDLWLYHPVIAWMINQVYCCLMFSN